jgi:hypothetical protein
VVRRCEPAGHGGSDSNGEKTNDLPKESFSQTTVIDRPQDFPWPPPDSRGSGFSITSLEWVFSNQPAGDGSREGETTRIGSSGQVRCLFLRCYRNPLQTHGKIEKGKDVKITWKFEKEPTSDALLRPLVEKLMSWFSIQRK